MSELPGTSGHSSSNRLLYVVSMNHFVNDGSTFLIASLFPAMEIVFGFSTYLIGLLVAVGYLVNMILQPIVGMFSQRFEPRGMLAFGISVMAVSMIMFAFSSTFLFMLLSVLLLRFGSSFFHPVGALAVSRSYSGEGLDRSMGVESAFGNLGIVSAFLISAPAYGFLGWHGPFLIYFGFQVTTVCVTLTSIRQPFQNPTARKKILEPQGSLFKEDKGRLDSRYLLGLPIFFVVTGFISGGSNAIFGNFGNLLLYHSGFSLTSSNDFMAGWVAFEFIGAIITGRLTRRFTRMRLLTAAYLLAGVSALGFSLLHSVTLLVAVPLLISGFAISITYPATYSELSEFTKGRAKQGRGAEYGMLFSSQIAGAAVLGYLGGYLSRSVGLDFSFLIASILLILSAFAVLIWSKLFRPGLLLPRY